MRIFKFRYKDADKNPCYKEISLPDDAAQFVGYDVDNNEVYEGDELVAAMDKDYRCKARFEARTLKDNMWKQNFDVNVAFKGLVRADKLAQRKVPLYRGKVMGYDKIVIGELQVRERGAVVLTRNARKLEENQYDWFILDKEGSHLVEWATAVEDEEVPS